MASLIPQLSGQHKAQEEDIDNLVPSSPKGSVEALPEYKSAFLQSCLSASALTFGTFTLKSGRQSPYFFNSGLLHSGSQVRAISTAFAQTLQHHCKLNPEFEFDVLFGPAYKGIDFRLHIDEFGSRHLSCIQAYLWPLRRQTNYRE